MCWNASFKPVVVAPYWPFLCVLHVHIMMWSGPQFETCEQSCGTPNIKKHFHYNDIFFFIIALSVSYQIQGYLVHVAVIVKTKITFVLKQRSRDASPEQEVLPFSQICAAWPAQIWTWMSAWWRCDCSNAHIVRAQQVGCSERSHSLSLEILFALTWVWIPGEKQRKHCCSCSCCITVDDDSYFIRASSV